MQDTTKLTEAELDQAIAQSFAPPRYAHGRPMDYRPVWYETQPAPTPACTADACHQGDAPCPRPQACRVPTERDPNDGSLEMLGRALTAAVLLAVVVGVLALLLI